MKLIVPTDIVKEFLSKPINLQEEWKLATGQPLTGLEKPVFYSAAEIKRIESELERLYQDATRSADHGNRFTLTAGAPGAGKTTLLNTWVSQRPPGEHGVYADPDETILKKMLPYNEDLGSGDSLLGNLIGAYTKWRWGSNYINGSIMNRAATDGFNIIYGTTGTSATVGALYDNVHQAGYESHVLIVAASDRVRLESSRCRYAEERSRFTRDVDVIGKGQMFYDRLPAHFNKAGSFDLYWRDAVDAETVLAATGRNGVISISDAVAIKYFDQDMSAKGLGASWNMLSRQYKERFTP